MVNSNDNTQDGLSMIEITTKGDLGRITRHRVTITGGGVSGYLDHPVVRVLFADEHSEFGITIDSQGWDELRRVVRAADSTAQNRRPKRQHKPVATYICEDEFHADRFCELTHSAGAKGCISHGREARIAVPLDADAMDRLYEEARS